jgi:hypothetical protein
MRSYLKGFNLTIDRWRLGRDEEGWKDMDWYDDSLSSGLNEVKESGPEFISALSWLHWDLEALQCLFSGVTPAIRSVRPSVRIDSGSGFGGSIALQGGTS